MKSLTILGSTGSIGRNACRIVRRYPDRFRLAALCAGGNVKLLAEQVREFSPLLAVVRTKEAAGELSSLVNGSQTRVLWGPEGYAEAASLPQADMVVSAVVGAAGLLPTLAAIEAKKPVALANKETLVMAGEHVTAAARKAGVPLLPVDSEHSAIFQCLLGQDRRSLSRILLTASGGPFREVPAPDFCSITPERALVHPTWEMGKKITIDSATLMNKGLEVIEARWLFDVPVQNIQVLVHPQSIVHSMVEFSDGAVIAQMGNPDMIGAIAFALSFPQRLPGLAPGPDFPSIKSLTFFDPDLVKFPCLGLAISALSRGGTFPAALNAANEMAVAAFLECGLRFDRIAAVIEEVLARHESCTADLAAVIAADGWARSAAQEQIRRYIP
ncbi:MAG: 1-deoxy-D-xylulose-5-phosphate reductoisomerase [Thermodesulfobacteriota bacterium]